MALTAGDATARPKEVGHQDHQNKNHRVKDAVKHIGVLGHGAFVLRFMEALFGWVGWRFWRCGGAHMLATLRPASYENQMAHRQAIDQIPDHLKPFIAEQDPSLYTPIDHAAWRYILRVSRTFFSAHAHSKYLEGLDETGISTESIPLISEMDQRLKRFGWRAVAVSGFIPPAIFMEFQSLGILPIACEMRTLEHLSYTPAPDIVHEAAGHAPIISDPEYSAYLRAYGEVSRKAIFSKEDAALYDAIRDLSDIKENPQSTLDEISDAQAKLDRLASAIVEVSEANLLARMNWWTVEYGLVGDLKHPKIYGAGLLSSVGESFHCLRPTVEKREFTLDCLNTTYDITKPQPQLYVTPSFDRLTHVLEEFARTMAFRKGGAESLEIARRAGTVTTSQLDTGVQISGVLERFDTDAKGLVTFLKYSGGSQISYRDQELAGHGPQAHAEGFSSPLGPIRLVDGSITEPAQLSDQELKVLPRLEFVSGIELVGEFVSSIRKDSKAIVIQYKNVTVRRGSTLLFDPSWGVYDLACGSHVPSVFGGAADRARFISGLGGYRERPRTPKCNLTPENKRLNEIFAEIRKVRESGWVKESLALLAELHKELDQKYPADWLSRIELLELNAEYELAAPWAKDCLIRLSSIAAQNSVEKEMIERGLEIVGAVFPT